MDTEDNDEMNRYDTWKDIREEGDHTVPQDSGKYRTSSQEGGKTAGKEGK